MREFASAFALDEIVIECTRPWRESELCLACLHADGRLELLSGAWERVLDYGCAAGVLKRVLDLYLLDVESGDIEQLPTDPGHDYVYPTVLPGDRILFATNAVVEEGAPQFRDEYERGTTTQLAGDPTYPSVTSPGWTLGDRACSVTASPAAPVNL